MNHEDLDFRTSVEALFVHALSVDMTPRLRDRLKQGGIDLLKLQPAYPRLVFSRCCRIAADELYPELSPEDGLRQLGRRIIEGYSGTMLGRAIVGFFRLIGVRRGLERVTRGFRNGDNYTETRFALEGSGRAHLWFNQVNGQPTFTLGMLEACMDWVGAKGARVQLVRTEGDGCVYGLEWMESGERPSETRMVSERPETRRGTGGAT
jgi:uncharacterized protein (TIGR02265 family)